MSEPALKQPRMSYQEYLEIEDKSDERHIFWDGEMFAMSGASPDHYAIETNLTGLLFIALRGHPCRPLTGNARLRAPHATRAVYADAVVVCGPVAPHSDDGNAVTNPTVIFEVLSDTTESFDRGDKFTYYRSFPSVREVVFVSQKERRVERFTRAEDATWNLRDLGPDDLLALDSVGVTIQVAELYEGSSLAAEG